ncbi:MAG TPA: hypothetical protein VMU60_09595 [Syntrophobacteria bacterium]|nr:hypothetical protein [Syntrophobacteria bacterium]
MDRKDVNINRYEKASVAAIAVTLEKVRRSGKRNSVDVALLDAFAAGIASGAVGMRR